MSATYALNGVGTVIAGVTLHVVGVRWVWAGAAVTFALGAVAAFSLVREPQAVAVDAEAATTSD